MKKLLMVLIFAMLPSSAFALIGFGIQGGQDMSKLEAYSYSEGLVSINALEMGTNPGNFGLYAFVDLFGYALEGEMEFGGGLYEFTFDNPINSLGPVEFIWVRTATVLTIKKNLMDVSIPFLAEAALNAGAGFSNHKSTPRASVGMVRELFGDDLTSVDALGDGMEDELITYLEDNLIEASGLHLQGGVRFKLLMLDTHLNLRYTMAKNVYDGSNGFMQMIFKTGFAF